jgi:hypothetical protein
MGDSPGLGRTIEVVPRVHLSFPSLPGASREAEADLPAVDAAGVDGARVVLRLGERTGAARMRAACVIAPADRWAPGVEELILARAAQMARGVFPGSITELHRLGPARVGQGFEEGVDGTGAIGAQKARVRGKVRLAFVEEGRRAVVCGALCIEADQGASCEAAVQGFEIGGALSPPPAPSLFVRGFFAAADHPLAAAAGAGLTAALAVGLILAKRPRPRRR